MRESRAQWDFSCKRCLERMGDIYQALILRLVIVKASSCIVSVMELIVHFTHYIAFLASVLKIIHLWYKTRAYSNYLISTHSMGNLELRSSRDIILLQKIGWLAYLVPFLCASVLYFSFLIIQGISRKQNPPENYDASGLNFVWKFPLLLTSLHDNESPWSQLFNLFVFFPELI